MGIFLSILKITGLTILVLLAVILILICLVLFVPIRYRINSDKGGIDLPVHFTARARWLLGIVSAVFDHNENGTSMSLRIFHIPLRRKKGKKENKHLFGSKKDRKETKAEEPSFSIYSYDEEDDDLKEDKPYTAKETSDHKDPEGCTEEDVDNKKPRKSLLDIAGAVYERITGIADRVSSLLKGAGDAFENIEYYHTALFNDARNREAVRYIYDRIKRLIKSIAPRKIRGRLDYGSEDPADTGRVLAIASVLYPLYKKNLSINPDFENRILAYDIKLRGRIYLNVVGVVLLQLYFNKKVRRFKNIMKKENVNGR
ncbi:MAG: DUF2953 domain-containing protein [Lachnospiraceae bacterium]|nr:DUF2953 domain-containing protein [Lachnospiraceae bacterium]